MMNQMQNQTNQINIFSSFKTYFFFSLLFLLLGVSCTKDNDPISPEEEEPINMTEGVLTVKINGVDFQSDLASAVIVPAILGSVQQFYISSSKNIEQGITEVRGINLSFYLPADGVIERGTYRECENEDSTNLCGYLTYSEGENGFYVGGENGSTEITITEVDYRVDGFVKGNFSGTLFEEDTGESKVLTDGEFSVFIGG